MQTAKRIELFDFLHFFLNLCVEGLVFEIEVTVGRVLICAVNGCDAGRKGQKRRDEKR